MKMLLIRAVAWFANLLTTCMLAQAILSWFVRDYRSPLAKIYRILGQITSPVVDPVRRFMSRFNTGMFDFSLLVAMLLVEFAARLIIRLLLII